VKYIILILCLTLAFNIMRASKLEDDAVMTIIGEAEGESFEGKLAVACVIRARGDAIKGMAGYDSKRVKYKLYSPKVERDARSAWYQSRDPGICYLLIDEATRFESTDYPQPTGLVRTKQIGKHIFYREINQRPPK
jgi:hypothetical protein